jgi:hypothetical protein
MTEEASCSSETLVPLIRPLHSVIIQRPQHILHLSVEVEGCLFWERTTRCLPNETLIQYRWIDLFFWNLNDVLSPFGGVCVWLIRRVLDRMIGFIDTLFTPLGNTGNGSAIAILHTSQFTVSQALKLSVFTSGILATDFITVCHFKSHMKSSFNSLIPFLLLFCNCQLNSVLLLPSSHLGRLASRNSTLHRTASAELFLTAILQGTRRKHSLSIVGKTCLQRCCIATEVTRLLSTICHWRSRCKGWILWPIPYIYIHTRLLLAYSLPREYVYRVVA